MKRIPIIFDVDTGIDDATTLMMACVSDSLEILGVTATHGNNHLENTLRNTLNVLKLCGREDIPVAAGARGPCFATGSMMRKMNPEEWWYMGQMVWGAMNSILKIQKQR